MSSNRAIGIGMVGYAFMGKAHSLAWRVAPCAFDLPLEPRMVAVAGRSQAVVNAARSLGWQQSTMDWRTLLGRDDIDLIDICTPGDSHAEIAIAALAAGKHVLCEKPLGNTVAEAEEMAAAASDAARYGIKAMVGFNYRRTPSAVLARDLIAAGKLGSVRHVRATYLQDWIVDPEFPLVWRLRQDFAGSGALGDIGAHAIDLAQFMLGDTISAVSALTETFIKERPLPAVASGLSATGSKDRGPVTVDDAVLFLARFTKGAIATFEATRLAAGRKNQLRIEINGSNGSLVFDMESMNELQYYSRSDPTDLAGFRRILVTEPNHPYISAWWPPGHVLGWDHTFVHEVADLVTAIGTATDIAPNFDDGLFVQRVLDAVATSAAQGAWQQVNT